jgi:hypothetical protein
LAVAHDEGAESNHPLASGDDSTRLEGQSTHGKRHRVIIFERPRDFGHNPEWLLLTPASDPLARLVLELKTDRRQRARVTAECV